MEEPARRLRRMEEGGALSEETTIRRGVRNARYTTLPNHVFEDQRLSMEARWLLGYLLSKPDNWTVRMGDIANKGACGRDKARRMVNELVEHGYAEKDQQRDDGRFGKLSLVIYDEPKERRDFNLQGSGVASLPQTENPSTVNPSTETPSTVNAALVNTDNLASTESSFERERGRDEGLEENPKTVERAFEKAYRAWPTSIGDSRPEALKAWLGLSADERVAAADEAQRYLTAVKATGRKHVVAHGVYLRERRWTQLPAREAEEKPTVIEAVPFGPWWSAARMKQLVMGPKAPPTALTWVERQLVEQGKIDVEELRREKLSKGGWPAVNAMHHKATQRQGVTVAMTLEPLASLMVAVPVGSAMYEAWKLEHALRGWPWIPDPGRQPVVYFPADGPGGLDAFEAAVRGDKNDARGREAAE